jgi:hypothetical protein
MRESLSYTSPVNNERSLPTSSIEGNDLADEALGDNGLRDQACHRQKAHGSPELLAGPYGRFGGWGIQLKS